MYNPFIAYIHDVRNTQRHDNFKEALTCFINVVKNNKVNVYQNINMF